MATGNLLLESTEVKVIRRDRQKDVRRCVGRFGGWLWTTIYQPALDRTRQRSEFASGK